MAPIAQARNTMAQTARNKTVRAPSTKAQPALNRNAREPKPMALPLKVQAGPLAPNRTEPAAKAAQKSSVVPLAHSRLHSPTEPAAKQSAAKVSKDGWPLEYLRTLDSIGFGPRRSGLCAA
jgi:hypothetical protein